MYQITAVTTTLVATAIAGAYRIYKGMGASRFCPAICLFAARFGNAGSGACILSKCSNCLIIYLHAGKRICLIEPHIQTR
ncbi:MAG: hypothetical protein ABSE07_01905 [Methanoregula sp.]